MRKYTVVFMLFSLAVVALALLALAPSAGAAVMEVTNNENSGNAAWIETPASLGPVRVWNHQNPDSTNVDWWKFNASGGQHIEVKYRKYSTSPTLSELGNTWTAYALWDLWGPFVPGINIYEYTSTRPGQGQQWQDYHTRDTFSYMIPKNLGGIYFIRVYVVPSGQGWDRTGYYFLNVTVSDVPSFDAQAQYDGVMGMHETYTNADPTVCVDFNFEDIYTIDLDATATSGDLLAITLSKADPDRRVYVEIWSRIPYGNAQKDHMLNRTYYTGRNLRIEATAPHTGTYYVMVYRNFNDEEAPDTAYTVTSFVDTKSLEGDDVAGEGTVVPKALKLTGRTLEMGYDTHDWYATEIKAGDRVYEITLDLTSPNLGDGHGVELCVYNEQGQVMWVVSNRYYSDNQIHWRDQMVLPPAGTLIYIEENVTWFVRVSVDPEITSSSLAGFETMYDIDFKLANRAPTLVTPFEEIYEWDEDGGISIELDSHFTDVDGDPMTYVVREKDPAFDVDSDALANEGFLNITSPPDWNGEDTWRLIAKDKGGGVTHEIEIPINIKVNPIPDRPRVGDPLTAECDEESSTSVNLSDMFYDVDDGAGAVLTYGWDDPGDIDVGVTIDPSTGEMDIVPDADVFGDFTLEVWCHDDVVEKVRGTVLLTVYPLNDVPRIVSSIPLVEMEEGDTDPVEVDMAPYFTDVDGDDLTYTFEFVNKSNEDHVTVIHRNNVLTESVLVVTIDDEYFYATVVVTIKCTDERNTFVEQNMVIEISPVPNAPVVTFKPQGDPSDIVEGDSLLFEVEDVYDHDEPEIGLHNITWYLDDVVVKSEVGTSSQYTYVSDPESSGEHTVKVVVRDPTGLGPTKDPTWTFFVEDKNRAPTAEIVTVPVALDEGDPLLLEVNVSDPDNDELTITWYHVNAADAILGTGKSVEVELPAGTQSIEVIVEDGKGGKATDTFVIKVNKVEEESGIGIWLGIIVVIVIVIVVALALVRMRSKPGISPEAKMDLDSIEKSYDPSGGKDKGYGEEYDPTPQSWEDYEELNY